MTNSASSPARAEELPERRSDRKVTIGHWAEYLLMRGIFFFFKLVGVDAASAIAGGFMRTVGPLIGPLSNRARTNLAHAFPDWSKSEIEKTVRGVWENLGRTTAEFAFLEKFVPSEGNERVAVENWNTLTDIAAAGKPVIFVSGHFANWEVMPVTLHAAGIDYGMVFRAANNPLIDELIIKTRAEVMSRRQIPKGQEGARLLVETIKQGHSLAMLLDQKLNSGISVPFMGRNAMTATSAAKLALKFGLPVIPLSIVRLKGARFRLELGDPLRIDPTGDDVYAMTLKINQALEEMIRAQPSQWLWLHRRWPKENTDVANQS